MKSSKKVLSVLLAFAVCLCTVPTVFSAEKSSLDTMLYNIYQDNMLFEQNKDAIFAGEGTPGDTISVTLINSSFEEVKSSRTTVSADGKFSVSFVAPEGSYSEYTVKFYCNSIEFKTLNNVVFGELWLSGGQSNMELPLYFEKDAEEILKNSENRSKWVRFLRVDSYVSYKGDINKFPVDPQDDIKECKWITAEDELVKNVSAVAYYFSIKMQKDLDMPVGVLETALGGSTIRTWLSRESIEHSKEVKDDLIKYNSYISRENWQENNEHPLTSMTCQYNKKLYPLRNFRIAGMIWYQGEGDAHFEYGMYTRSFLLLQEQLTKLFKFDGDKLPMIMSQLAAYPFGFTIDDEQSKNFEFSMIDKNNESIVTVSNYDVALDYDVAAATMHPIIKKPIGDRMAVAAQGLVYKMNDFYGVSYLDSFEIKDSSIYVKMANVGDTLKSKGDTLYGFTICGKEGVYLPAKAQIVSADTIKVYCESIKNPKAVRYAMSLYNGRSNVYSYKDGEYGMPITPFATDINLAKLTWHDFGWTDCDTNSIWRVASAYDSQYYDIWEGVNADVEAKNDGAYEGEGRIEITSTAEKFGVKPIVKYYNNEFNFETTFRDFSKDMSKFDTLSIMVKNEGKEDIIFEGLKFVKDGKTYYASQTDKKKNTVISANGDWQKVTFNLNSLYLIKEKIGICVSNFYLDSVEDMEFYFTGTNQSKVSIDDITFTIEKEEVGRINFIGNSLFVKVFNFVSKIVAKILDLIG